MKVCIDIQSVIRNPTGVGRYTLELVKALSKIANRKDIILSYFNFLGRYNGIDYFPNRQIKIIPGRIYNQLWKRFHFPPLNWFIGDFDVYHFPNFCMPPMNHGRSIITVHDLAFMRYPEYIEPKNLKFLQRELPRSLGRADRIIAVSYFTKRELIELFNIPEEKVVVIYEGVPCFQGQTLPVLARSDLAKYILCVSTIEPRKNIEGLIQAFHLCRLRDYKLVIVGKKGWITDIRPQKDVIFLGYVNELYSIYKNAKAFVFPSFYEGFGLPPLEAMACGVPVVSTRFEVLGDGARFIDPRNPEDIAGGIREVLENPQPWIKKGLEQAKKFSWEKTAEETLRLYEDCNRL